MLFAGTKENRALADATISHIKAEARLKSTRANLLKAGAYSIFVLCLGLGCSAAFFGYASIKNAQSSSDDIARILVKAINSASITTKGEVRLSPGATLTVDRDAIVKLDPTASVKLESGATVQTQGTRPPSYSSSKAAQATR